MAQRAIILPIRALSRPHSRPAQWICSRCLATQSATINSSSPPPSSSKANTREALSKRLAHDIPIQYLQHSTSNALHPEEQAQREKAEAHRRIVGVVVSSGRMRKTVKVRIPGKEWNKKIGKYFSRPTNHLVHDPNDSLVAGDVVELHRLRVSTIVHHVVASIVTPFGTPISERPPIPTPDERLAEYKARRFAKLHRRELRQKAADGDEAAIEELKAMGLDPGKGVEPGKRQIERLEKGTGEARTPKKGAILGNKGQKLPEGVLPGGRHEVGKINERARKNKENAMKMEAQAEENLLEAKEVGEQLQTEDRLGQESLLPTQGPNVKVEEKP